MQKQLRSPRRNRLLIALKDIVNGLGRWQLWTALAWEDIVSTYRRSLFGVFWITLSFAVFIGIKLIVFIPIMGAIDRVYYTVYLTIGYFLWTFIGTIVNTAPNIFTGASGFIKNDPLPFSIYVYRLIARSLFNITLMGAVVVGAIWYLGFEIHAMSWLAIPGILVYILNAVWVTLFLGVLCARYRDMTHLVQTIMRFMFFLVPIFWLPAMMGPIFKYLYWNPFLHFLWIVRNPIMDGDPAINSWIIVGIVTVVGWSIAIFTFSRFRHRVVFWF